MALSIRILILGTVLFLVDLYFYQAIVAVLKGYSDSKRSLVSYIYWGFTVFTFLTFLSFSLGSFTDWPKYIRVYLLALVVMVLFSKIIGSLFIATDDIIRLFRWIGSYFTTATVAENENIHRISRLKFLNQIALGMTVLPFAGFVYGMVRGAFDYKIHTTKLILPKLPDAFNGLKIVQISDIHSGSFVSSSHLEEVAKIIQKQKPDIVFFTGDLVNNRASETAPFIETLSTIKAPMGVFSILGNHDYGDYVPWDSVKEKLQNLNDLKDVHGKLGWKLLLNEHIPLKRGDAEIALIGIENWGGNFKFSRYGDLKKAYAGAEKYPVKLLLSHDPSHWNIQVKEEYTDIDVTFSGHTHGGQFGIEIPGFKWSPSQYAYKQWAGLYSEQNQHLYVNRGVGFLGYPGRVGISPEITVMELYNS